MDVPVWRTRGYLPHYDDRATIQHITFHLADSLPADVLREIDLDLKSLPPQQQSTTKRDRINAWLDAGHGSCILRHPEIATMVQNTLLHFHGTRYHLHEWVIMPNHVHTLLQPLNQWPISKTITSWKTYTATQLTRNASLRTGTPPLRNASLRTGTPPLRNASLRTGTPPLRNASLRTGTPPLRNASLRTGTPPLRNASLRTGILNLGFDLPTPIWHREYYDRYIRDQTHYANVIQYIHQNPVKAHLTPTPESYPWSSANPQNANLRIPPPE